MSNRDAYIGILIDETADEIETILRGGEGSGHHDHAGRPGEVGGSQPSGGNGSKSETKRKSSGIRFPHDEEWADEAGLVPRGESRWIVDESGKVLAFTDRGNPEEIFLPQHAKIDITPFMDMSVRDIHTHPDNTWPSDGDWAGLGWSMNKEISAILLNGDVITIRLAEGRKTKEGHWITPAVIRDSWAKFEDEIFREKWDEYRDVSVEDIIHDINIKVAADLGGEITVRKIGDIDEEWARDYAVKFPSVVERGGEGSGHHGHAGRPGEVGGSAPSGVKPSSRQAADMMRRNYGVADDIGVAAWIGPDGEGLAPKKDHQITAKDVLKKLGMPPDTYRNAINATVNMIDLGLIRYTRFQDIHGFTVPEENITDAQKEAIVTIMIKARSNRPGSDFLFDRADVDPKPESYGAPHYLVKLDGRQVVDMLDLDTDFWEVTPTTIRVIHRGGAGSGHHGHEGRPGEVGGSLPSGIVDAEVRASRKERLFKAYKKLSEVGNLRHSKVAQEYFATATEWFLERKVGINFEEIDSINHHKGYVLRDDRGNALTVQMGEAEWDVYGRKEFILSWIEANNKGTGFGSAFMKACKSYADGKEILFRVVQVTNPEFYRRFNWLDEPVDSQGKPKNEGWGNDEFIYTPTALRKRTWLDSKDHIDSDYDLTESPHNPDGKKWPPKVFPIERGGPGSGHHGHAGRPGEVGGSLPSGGSNISDFLKVPQTSLWEPVNRAFAAIEKVHGVNPLKELRIFRSKSKRRRGSYYTYWTPMGIVAEKMGIRLGEKDDASRALTTAHETGHFIDHTMFGSHLYFTSEDMIDQQAESGKTDAVLDLISDNHDEARAYQKWWKAITSSQEYFRMETYPSGIMHIDENGNFVEGKKVGATHYRYTPPLLNSWRQPGEYFARSYSQYIATRSGDAWMQNEVESELQMSLRGGAPTQWEEESFKPIAEAFDELFDSVGLLR